MSIISSQTERKILSMHDFHPEDIAMVQALYSRDPKSVSDHLEKVKASGSGKFMGQFYVGYGHKSIGDCGSTTIFVEGVSMLAAKAIQDHPLYSGQEASTRYIDFANQPILDPLNTPESRTIQEKWMDFYTRSQEPVASHIRSKYPMNDGEDVKMYEKAVKARVFDTLRSFLPAGATTLVSWHSNLRQIADKLASLRHHILPELRDIAGIIQEDMIAKYPNSFSHKTYEASETYSAMLGAKYTYFDPATCSDHVSCSSTISPLNILQYNELLQRPPKTEVPAFLDDLGSIQYEFLLDFGSFRDLQRHRNGICRMPLLTTRWGFHPWYLNELPPAVRAEAERLIIEQTIAINTLPTTAEMKQYYIGMGFRVPCKVTRGLKGTLYLIELRAGKTVHPTMRRVAQEMASTLSLIHPEIPMYADMDQDDWDVRRGKHDITIKEKTS